MTYTQAFFPKNRGNWKQYSSWEPEEKEKKTVADTRFPPEVEVKKGYSWSDQLGIVIACLIDSNQEELVKWTTEVHFAIIINLAPPGPNDIVMFTADPYTSYNSTKPNH